MARQLLLSRRVKVLEPRQYVLDRFYIVLAVYLVEQLPPCVHCNCRPDASKASTNVTSSNGLSSLAFLKVACEHCCDVCNSSKVTAVQVRRHSDRFTVGHPFFPYLNLSVGSRLHSAIGDPCVSSSRITCKTASEFRRKPVHKFYSGKGICELKKVRNLLSFSKCHDAFHPYDREGTSPSAFLFPTMCRVISGDALFFLRRITMIRSRQLSAFDRFDAPRVCQATVAELLLHTPTCVNLVHTLASSTSQPSISATISKSELVMSLLGLSYRA